MELAAATELHLILLLTLLPVCLCAELGGEFWGFNGNSA